MRCSLPSNPINKNSLVFFSVYRINLRRIWNCRVYQARSQELKEKTRKTKTIYKKKMHVACSLDSLLFYLSSRCFGRVSVGGLKSEQKTKKIKQIYQISKDLIENRLITGSFHSFGIVSIKLKRFICCALLLNYFTLINCWFAIFQLQLQLQSLYARANNFFFQKE